MIPQKKGLEGIRFQVVCTKQKSMKVTEIKFILVSAGFMDIQLSTEGGFGSGICLTHPLSLSQSANHPSAAKH